MGSCVFQHTNFHLLPLKPQQPLLKGSVRGAAKQATNKADLTATWSCLVAGKEAE